MATDTKAWDEAAEPEDQEEETQVTYMNHAGPVGETAGSLYQPDQVDEHGTVKHPEDHGEPADHTKDTDQDDSGERSA